MFLWDKEKFQVKWLGLFLLLSSCARAEGPWQHYKLDVRLTVPPGWKIIQGPVMLQLDPKRPLKAERRPSFNLTWQQTPPTLDEFKEEVVGAVKKKGGSLAFVKPLQISGYPALRVRAVMPEGPYAITADLVLIRVDRFAGHQSRRSLFLSNPQQS